MAQVEIQKQPEVKEGQPCFRIVAGSKHLLDIRFQRRCLISNTIYVMLEPGKDIKTLTAQHVKFMRRALDFNFAGTRLFCEVDLKNPQHVKFAKLFGFMPYDNVRNILILERFQ